MEILIVLLIFLGALAATMHSWSGTRRALRIVAERTGLTHEEGEPFLKPAQYRERLEGRFDGRWSVQYLVEYRPRRRVASLTVATPRDFPRELTLRGESVGERLERQVRGPQDVEIGDESFDACIRVEGSEVQALAVLDYDTREYLKDILGTYDMTYKNGRVLATQTKRLGDPDYIELFIDSAAHILECVCLSEGAYAAALLTRACEDPIPAVQEAATRVLFREYGGDEFAKQAAKRLLDGGSSYVRTLCYIELNDVQQLSGIAKDSEAALNERVAALEHLRDNSSDAAFRIAKSIGRCAEDELNRLVVAIAESRDKRSEWLALLKLLISPSDVALARRVVRSLSSKGGHGASALLRDLLDVPDNEVRRLAASMLGRHGRIEDLSRLRKLLTKERMSAETKNALRGAIEALQGRFGTAESAGGLTIAEPANAGALSNTSGS